MRFWIWFGFVLQKVIGRRQGKVWLYRRSSILFFEKDRGDIGFVFFRQKVRFQLGEIQNRDKVLGFGCRWGNKVIGYLVWFFYIKGIVR